MSVAVVGEHATVLVAQKKEPEPKEQTKEITVYVTKTGARYHRSSCHYLSRSKFPMTLKEAKTQEYTACKVCRPPQ